MNHRLTVTLALASGLFACQQQDVDSKADNDLAVTAVDDATIAETIEPVSGLDFDGFDTTVRPQDDLFAAVNGKWIAETEDKTPPKLPIGVLATDTIYTSFMFAILRLIKLL